MKIITLIHGTFATDTEWVKQDSVFCSELQKTLEEKIQFETFQWSGKNTHSSRLVAGEGLSKHIKRLKEENPDAKQYLVGHSHGGNIALYSMRDPKTNAIIDRIVTLGTPFIHIGKRRIDEIYYLLVLFFMMFAYAIELYLGSFLFGTSILVQILSSSNFFLWLLPFAGYIGFYFVLLPLRHWIRLRQNKSYNSLYQTSLSSDRVLVAMVPGDEAGRYLGMLDGFSRIPPFISRAFLQLGAASITMPLLALYWFSVWAGFYLYPDQTISLSGGAEFELARFIADNYGFLYTYFLVSIPLGIIIAMLGWAITQLINLIAPLFLRSHPFGFGWESLTANWITSITVSKWPSTIDGTVEYLNAAGRKGGGLRHNGFYKDKQLISNIGNWISGDAQFKKRFVTDFNRDGILLAVLVGVLIVNVSFLPLFIGATLSAEFEQVSTELNDGMVPDNRNRSN